MRNDYTAANAELDRLESNYRLADPQTSAGEVARIVEQEIARAGLKPAVRQASIQDDPLRKRIYAAAAQFVKSRPQTDPVNGFLPTEANEQIMHNYMAENGLDFTSAYSFEQAFLATRDKLTPPAPQGRATVNIRKLNGVEISHESLDRLSAREIERLSQNPAFVAAVDSLPPRPR
jgi:hypothetical protein